MKANNPAVWFEIYVSDINRAKKFYEQVFDLKLSDLPTPSDLQGEMKMLAFPSEMEQHGASGALVEMKGFEAGGNSTIVYFYSADCAVEEERIEQAGGKVLQNKFPIGEYGFCSVVMDTEGNTIGFNSMN
ncbi:VOC family protein [Cognataquiflexum rubidum]|uniref:VOC family protein n=1 Tax=Cognataquiflexum rubidum TaxID=2922273 RepID=UPI001F140FCF|nr:VOC family protein [Cognataquiflexum rubidum]MCH6233390.1 VOC family protein [Cognataquiflexum rubidum]